MTKSDLLFLWRCPRSAPDLYLIIMPLDCTEVFYTDPELNYFVNGETIPLLEKKCPRYSKLLVYLNEGI